MKMNKTFVAGLAVMALLATAPAMAALTTMNTARILTGNQTWVSIGLEFDVLSPIVVRELGVYDSAGNGIVGSATLTAQIWDSTTQTILASQDFTSADQGTFDATSNYLFKPLGTALTLQPGRYAILGYGFDSSNPQHNSNMGGLSATDSDIFNGGGLITHARDVWGHGTNVPGEFWINTYDTNPDFFGGPNMRFEAAAPTVPAPAAILLAGIGTALVGALKRRSL
jgi:hypothetical protein